MTHISDLNQPESDRFTFLIIKESVTTLSSIAESHDVRCSSVLGVCLDEKVGRRDIVLTSCYTWREDERPDQGLLQEQRPAVLAWLRLCANLGDLIVAGRLVLVPETMTVQPLLDYGDLPSWTEIGRETLESFAIDGRGGEPGMDLQDRGDTYIYIAAGDVSHALGSIQNYRDRFDLYLPHEVHWRVASAALRVNGVKTRWTPTLADLPSVSPQILTAAMLRDLLDEPTGFEMWRTGLATSTSLIRAGVGALDETDIPEFSRQTLETHLRPTVDALVARARRTSPLSLALRHGPPVAVNLLTPNPTGALGRAVKPAWTWAAGRRLRRQADAASAIYSEIIDQLGK